MVISGSVDSYLLGNVILGTFSNGGSADWTIDKGSLVAMDQYSDAAVFNGKTVKFTATGQYNMPSAGLRYSSYFKPQGSTYDEVWGKMSDYGPAIKAKDPNALLLGPDEWGWDGYFDSGIDAESQNHSDRTAHGNQEAPPQWRGLFRGVTAATAAGRTPPLGRPLTENFPATGGV